MIKFLIVLVISVSQIVIAQPVVSSTSNETVSLNDFEIINLIAKGTYSFVYEARKIGGSDDGTLYALKAVNITYAREADLKNKNSFDTLANLINERKMLQAVGDWVWANQLHYAFNDGIFLFYVLELVPSGEVQEEFGRQKWEISPHTRKQVLVEIVTAVDQLHNMNIEHRDLKWDNFVIDSQGHIKLIDFGYAIYRNERDLTSLNWFKRLDWYKLGRMCEFLFFFSSNATEDSLIELLYSIDKEGKTSNDLKNHEYFNEIDWNAVVERKSDSGPLPNVQTNRTVEQIESKEVLFQSHESETLTRDEYYQIRGFNYVNPKHQNQQQ